MLQQMKTAAKNMWKSLTHAVNTDINNRELILARPIKGTPFTLAGNEDQGYFLTIGAYRLTEPETTPEEAVEKLDSETWEIISRLVAAYIHFDKKTDTTTFDQNELIEN